MVLATAAATATAASAAAAAEINELRASRCYIACSVGWAGCICPIAVLLTSWVLTTGLVRCQYGKGRRAKEQASSSAAAAAATAVAYYRTSQPHLTSLPTVFGVLVVSVQQFFS